MYPGKLAVRIVGSGVGDVECDVGAGGGRGRGRRLRRELSGPTFAGAERSRAGDEPVAEGGASSPGASASATFASSAYDAFQCH